VTILFRTILYKRLAAVSAIISPFWTDTNSVISPAPNPTPNPIPIPNPNQNSNLTVSLRLS